MELTFFQCHDHVYLSFTYEDLKENRRAVFSSLRQAGYAVIAMEEYVATNRSQVDQCLKDMGRSDLYLGIFVFLYRDVPPAIHGNSEGLFIYFVFYGKTSVEKTAEMGSKRPNELGLYDMTGNVFEWLEDCWHSGYDGAPEDGLAWLEAGDGDCARRVVRGRSWNFTPELLRASNRSWSNTDFRGSSIGFRLARNTP